MFFGCSLGVNLSFPMALDILHHLIVTLPGFPFDVLINPFINQIQVKHFIMYIGTEYIRVALDS